MARQRLEKLEQQRAKIERQIRLQKQKLKNAERKKETRRKIILGGLVEKHCALHPDSAFSHEVQRLIAEFVKGDRERELFGLAPLSETANTAPPATANDAQSVPKTEAPKTGFSKLFQSDQNTGSKTG